MFKFFNDEIALIITDIFNNYIETGKIEKELIEGYVVMIFKGNENDDDKNKTEN